MANIEISALPPKNVINPNDLYHIKDGSNSGDFRATPSVVKDSVFSLAIADDVTFGSITVGDLTSTGTITFSSVSVGDLTSTGSITINASGGNDTLFLNDTRSYIQRNNNTGNVEINAATGESVTLGIDDSAVITTNAGGVDLTGDLGVSNRAVIGTDSGSSARLTSQGSGSSSGTFSARFSNSVGTITHSFDDSGGAVHIGNITVGSTSSGVNTIQNGTGDTLVLQKSTNQPSLRMDGATNNTTFSVGSGDSFSIANSTSIGLLSTVNVGLDANGIRIANDGSFANLPTQSGSMYANASNGLVLYGEGSTTDVAILNRVGDVALQVPGNTTNVALPVGNFGIGVTPSNPRLSISGGSYSALSASGQGAFYATPAGGLVQYGRGTAYDVTTVNNANTTVMRVPTGTQHLELLGSLAMGGATANQASSSLAITNTTSFNEIVFIGNDPTNILSQTTDVFQIGCSNAGSFEILTNNGTRAAIIDTSQNTQFVGNVSIGTGTGATYQLDVQGAAGVPVFAARNSAAIEQIYTANSNDAMAAGESTAVSAVYMRQSSATGRSASVAGTLNASGADYAEYKRIADWLVSSGAKVLKGDLVGFNAKGEVTTRWSESIKFAIKSTKPNLVGGDTWAKTPKPKAIACDDIKYTGLVKPSEPLEVLEPDVVLKPDVEDFLDLEESVEYIEALEEYDTYLALMEKYKKYLLDLEQYDLDVVQFEKDQEAHANALEKERQRVDALNKEAFDEWDAIHQVERASVDRIAFCGIAPLNGNVECKAGDYIIPMEGEDDSIVWIALDKDAEDDCTTLKQLKDHLKMQKRTVGQVDSIGEDGRPLINVRM